MRGDVGDKMGGASLPGFTAAKMLAALAWILVAAIKRGLWIF